MKKLLLILLATIVVALGTTVLVIYLRATIDAEPVVTCGQLVRYHDFPSRHIQPRTVSVWLPDGYTVGDSCCVMYMHDGKMLFDGAVTWNGQEWRVDETFGRMIQADSIPPCIVVAIDNTSKRMTEYFPTKTWQYVAPDEREHYDEKNILGDNYLRFLVEELKPFRSHSTPSASTRISSAEQGACPPTCLCDTCLWLIPRCGVITRYGSKVSADTSG